MTAGPLDILLVEDEQPLRDVFSDLLQRSGYTVVAVGTGAAAVDRFREGVATFRAVVLDFQLPDMGGAEVLRTIRSLAPTVPVIVTTGFPAEDAMGGWEGQRGIRYLQKPFTVKRLIEALAAATGG